MLGGYGELIASLAVFLFTHSVPAIRPVRARCVSLAGERTYLIAYSLISIIMILWMVSAVIRAPYVELWAMTPGTMWGTALLMIPATALLVFGLTTPNTLSLPIRSEMFDPKAPGVLAFTRHPILLGFALWALAHILSNGTLSALLLFGFAFLFSIAGMFIVDARRRRAWGREIWSKQTARTALLSWRFEHIPILDRRWLIVAALYALMIWLHPLALGVQPLPL